MFGLIGQNVHPHVGGGRKEDREFLPSRVMETLTTHKLMLVIVGLLIFWNYGSFQAYTFKLILQELLKL